MATNIVQEYRGGRPRGMSWDTHEEYMALVRDFDNAQAISGVSQRDFCLEKGISRGKLQAAIKHRARIEQGKESPPKAHRKGVECE